MCHSINVSPNENTSNDKKDAIYNNLLFEGKNLLDMSQSKVNHYFLRMANGRSIYHYENDYYFKKVHEYEAKGLAYEDTTPLNAKPLSYSTDALITNVDEIHIVILWKIGSRLGQTHIMKRNIPIMANRNNPVLLSLDYDVNVAHDFNKDGYYKADINAKLFLPQSSSDTNITFGTKNLSPSIFWITKTSYTITLRPNKVEVLPLSCMITSPGIYDLNLFNVSILDENCDAVIKTHIIPNQYLIIVNNSSESNYESRPKAGSMLQAMQEEKPFIDSGPLYDGIDMKILDKVLKDEKKRGLTTVALTPLPPPDI